MQQQAVVLCAYLASRGQQPTEIPSAPKDPLVEVILKRYAGVYQPALRGKCGLHGARTILSFLACLKAPEYNVSDLQVRTRRQPP